MATYALRARELPLDEGWDVIVVGGGPAGCTAATAAAREGAKTLLVEATGCLGGMGTSGLVPCWCPFSDHERIIYRGLAETVFTRSKQGMPHLDPNMLDWVPIDPELLKRIYDDLVTSAGARVRFNTQLASVETDGDGVSTLIFSSKAGLTAARAKSYVDCTGDADLAAWAGARFAQGAEETHEVMPATHCFVMSNVDIYAAQHRIGWHHIQQRVNAMVATGRFPEIKDTHFVPTYIGPGTVSFNAGHLWDVDSTDPASVSQALMQGRRMAAAFRDGLAEFAPEAFGNAFLVSTGALMGIRESRRIVGDYTLTVEDYFARRSFPDDICRNAYPIDLHTAKDEITQANAGKIHAMERYESYRPGETHGIPYRSLLPQGVRNVLVAGRAISCDRLVQASVRVMPVCLAMGEAAGIAAALAAAGDADVHAVDTAHLRTRLLEEGAYLPEPSAV